MARCSCSVDFYFYLWQKGGKKVTGTKIQSPTHHGNRAHATPGKANYGKGRAGNPQTTPLQLAEGFSKYSCLYKSFPQSGD